MAVLIFDRSAINVATRSPPGLGTALLVPTRSNQREDLREALSIRQDAPWCQVILATESESIVEVVDIIGPECGVIAIKCDDPGRITQAAVDALTGRGGPTLEQFIDYLNLRLPHEIVSRLQSVLAGAAFGDGVRRWLARKRIGSPRDWRIIWATVQWLGGSGAIPPRDSFAISHGLSGKALASRCKHQFGLSYAAARRMVAWEGLVEAGLRYQTTGSSRIGLRTLDVRV